ncbi:MAG: hypothetical protein ACJ8CR_11125, partial [Roseiflexaceae bacterium]
NMMQALLSGGMSGGLGGGLGKAPKVRVSLQVVDKPDIIPTVLPNVRQQLESKLESLLAHYGVNVPVDKVVRLKILLGEVGSDDQSIRQAMIDELEAQLAVETMVCAPSYKALQMKDLKASDFKLQDFLDTWDMHIER